MSLAIRPAMRISPIGRDPRSLVCWWMAHWEVRPCSASIRKFHPWGIRKRPSNKSAAGGVAGAQINLKGNLGIRGHIPAKARERICLQVCDAQSLPT